MTPHRGEYSIHLPVTFDYKGGRSTHTKTKVIATLVLVFAEVIGTIYLSRQGNIELWQKVLYIAAMYWVGVLIIRFAVFGELRFSDIIEELKAKDFRLNYKDFWQIFAVDEDYPYTCYFRNGYKGVFVRMERGAITGKANDASFDHYDIVGDAYNLAHSLNMNIVHLDYMDNVGNDPRMNALYDDLNYVENPDMRDMLVDIYDNLNSIMSRNYTSYDVYLFLSRDNVENLNYNVQLVSSRMLGGNYITYKILDSLNIARMTSALMNMHEFSIVDAESDVLEGTYSQGIIPIHVVHADGSIEKLNKTQEEKRIERAEMERKQKEALEARERAKQERKNRGKKKAEQPKEEVVENLDEDLDLF